MNKLMIKLTVFTESFFFLSLIVAYLYFWRSGHFEAAALQHLDIKTTGVFSALLFSSSFTFWRAESNFKKKNHRAMQTWLSITIILGLIFLGGQAHEYYKLISHHLTISKSEFGSSFFTLTGFHGLHVFIGLIILSIVLLLSARGNFSKGDSTVIPAVGIYWHFVDIVWFVVFSIIYVLPYIL